jgi:hypothetical protein
MAKPPEPPPPAPKNLGVTESRDNGTGHKAERKARAAKNSG